MSVEIKYGGPADRPVKEVVMDHGAKLALTRRGNPLRLEIFQGEEREKRFYLPANSSTIEFFETCLKMARQVEAEQG